MDLDTAKEVMLRTHLAALDRGVRANGMHLESGPGIGKSDTIMQYAEDLSATLKEPVGVVIFMLATISSVDVRGFMLPVKQASGLETIFSTPPWFPGRGNTHVVEPDGTWHEPGEKDAPRVGVLGLDEFSQAEDDVKKAAAELIYKGNVGTCVLPPAWRVISAGNRTKDRSGVMRELMFLVNRRCRLSIDASLPAWLEWANKQAPAKRPHYLMISFAQKNPDIVFQDAVPDGTDPFCTPRTLCLLDQDLKALRSAEDVAADKLPTDAVAREVAAGWIGGAAAAQLFTHMKYADDLPDIDDVVRHPATAKLPDRRDAQMVCAYMLAHNLDEKNAGPIMEYIERMGIEMQALAVRAVMAQQARLQALAAHPAYTRWLVKNRDLIRASQS